MNIYKIVTDKGYEVCRFRLSEKSAEILQINFHFDLEEVEGRVYKKIFLFWLYDLVPAHTYWRVVEKLPGDAFINIIKIK